MEKILVSACLSGERVRYDNRLAGLENPVFLEWKEKGLLVKVCPEVEGGLSVPRLPVQIYGGSGCDVLEGKARVLTADGQDHTSVFIRGAERCLNIIKAHGVRYALLKEKSPSCGSHYIYDGTFSRKLVPGSGVTTALLRLNNVRIFSETEIDYLASILNRNF